MSKKWFDFLSLILLAIVIFSMDWDSYYYDKNIPILFSLSIVLVALRIFFYHPSKNNEQGLNKKTKKVIFFLFGFLLFLIISFSIFIYLLMTNDYFAYKANTNGHIVTLECNSTKGALGKLTPFNDLFKITKPIFSSRMRLLELKREGGATPINVYYLNGNDNTKALVFSDYGKYIYFVNRENLNIKMYTNKSKDNTLMNDYNCKEIDESLFDSQVKAFFENRKKDFKF